MTTMRAPQKKAKNGEKLILRKNLLTRRTLLRSVAPAVPNAEVGKITTTMLFQILPIRLNLTEMLI